jgi:hypothetical protein
VAATEGHERGRCPTLRHRKRLFAWRLQSPDLVDADESADAIPMPDLDPAVGRLVGELENDILGSLRRRAGLPVSGFWRMSARAAVMITVRFSASWRRSSHSRLPAGSRTFTQRSMLTTISTGV